MLKAKIQSKYNLAIVEVRGYTLYDLLKKAMEKLTIKTGHPHWFDNMNIIYIEEEKYD